MKLEAGQERLEARIASIADGQQRLEACVASIAAGLERLEALLGSGQRERAPAMQPDGLAEGAKIDPVDPGEGKSWDETFRERLDRVRVNERKNVRRCT
jgi:exonuclease VII small subunit